MAASFPTALQRTSDERWVTLDVVARDSDRAVARIVEAPDQTAVVRLERGQPYDHHLRDLLSTPPPDSGAGVHVAWPVDLLHDLDARAVGYAATRPPAAHTFPLADFVDPQRRAEIAPMATRRHLLRVARNVATATAALHHSGYAGIRGRQFRLDDRARIVVVRTDELIAGASAVQKADDQRRLGYLVVRLLGGRAWASDGELAALIRHVGDPTKPAFPAEEWFFALRRAERALPKTSAVASAVPQVEKRVIVGTDLATALREARDATSPPAPPHPAQPRPAPLGGSSPLSVPGGQSRQASTGVASGCVGRHDVSPHHPTHLTDPGAGVSDATTSTPTTRHTSPTPMPARRRRQASHVDGRHTVRAHHRRSVRALDRRSTRALDRRSTHALDRHIAAAGDETASTRIARHVFGAAVGLTFGGLASVAPFATFLAVACVMVLRAAITTGLRRSTMGPLQTVAITLTRLVPFATGGLAFAAFILLDLLLVLGLCMALARLLFDYGPGFTLTWILQLPEVPGLVRLFAIAVGAFAGLVRGGQTYDRIRRGAGARRMIATPAIAMALAMGILAVDASVTWWPLPLAA